MDRYSGENPLSGRMRTIFFIGFFLTLFPSGLSGPFVLRMNPSHLPKREECQGRWRWLTDSTRRSSWRAGRRRVNLFFVARENPNRHYKQYTGLHAQRAGRSSISIV